MLEPTFVVCAPAVAGACGSMCCACWRARNTNQVTGPTSPARWRASCWAQNPKEQQW